MGIRFDRILTSPLARARQTAEITAEVYGSSVPVESVEALSDRSDIPAVIALLSGAAASVLCVGHEPLLSRLAATLISRDGSVRIAMKKSGVIAIECDGPPAPGRGILRLHVGPAELLAVLGPG